MVLPPFETAGGPFSWDNHPLKGVESIQRGSVGEGSHLNTLANV